MSESEKWADVGRAYGAGIADGLRAAFDAPLADPWPEPIPLRWGSASVAGIVAWCHHDVWHGGRWGCTYEMAP